MNAEVKNMKLKIINGEKSNILKRILIGFSSLSTKLEAPPKIAPIKYKPSQYDSV